MNMKFKLGRKAFYFILGGLALLLIVTGLLHNQLERILSKNLIEKDLPNGIMFVAVGVMFWNRKIRKDETKAAAENKALEEEAAAAKSVDAESPDTEGADQVNASS